MRNCIAIFLIHILFVHSCVWANDGKLVASNLVKKMEIVQNKINSNPLLFLKKNKAIVLKHFSGRSNEIYFDGLVKKINQSRFLPEVKFHKDHFILAFEGKKYKLTITDLKTKTFGINSQKISLNEYDSLKILIESQGHSLSATNLFDSLLDKIIPSAYAFVITISAFFLLVCLMVLIYVGAIEGYFLLRKVRKLVKECNKVNKSMKFEDTVFFDLFTEVSKKIGKEEIQRMEQSKFCSQYVEEQFEKAQNSWNREEADQICRMYMDSKKCFDKHNNGIRIDNSNRDIELEDVDIEEADTELIKVESN